MRDPLTAEQMRELNEKFDELLELHKKQAGTMEKLRAYYALAYHLGLHPMEIKGHVKTRVQEGPINGKPWVGAVMTAEVYQTDCPEAQAAAKRMGAVDVRKIKLTDLPMSLWPRSILDRLPRAQRETLERGLP